MTRRIVRTILVVLSVATLYMSLAPEASAQTCSLATVAGSWAATLTGTILFPAPTGPVPAAAVLRFNLDTAGNVSGTEARNVGGGFANETFKGTFTGEPQLHRYDNCAVLRVGSFGTHQRVGFSVRRSLNTTASRPKIADSAGWHQGSGCHNG